MYVLTQYNSISLHRHIVRTYKFDTFSKGFVQILAAQQTPTDQSWFQGTADAVRRNLDIVAASRGDLVMILSGDHLYRMDYRQMLKEHVETGAHITLGVLPCSSDEIAEFGAVRVDDEGRIVEFREKPKTAEARAGMEVSPDLLASRGIQADRPYLASMGIYLFDKQVLLDSLDNELVDFGHHVIPACVDRLRVQSHFFRGYWRDIGSIRAFYEAHMDMVRPEPPFDFYDQNWPFFTHPRYLPGSRLVGCRFENSVLAGGAVISDSTIEESVVGIRTTMENAEIRRALIMGEEDHPPNPDRVGIREGARIENAIVDLNAYIGRGARIVNAEGVESAEGDGWVIRDGIVVVLKNAEIPDGTVI
jgi:glucose-1-phosphate adenylyltransferase